MSASHEFVMPGRSDATAAFELLEKLRADAVRSINAAGVEEMSTPMISVIVAGGEALRKKGEQLLIKSPSDGFVNAFSDLGLFSEMMKLEFTK